MALPDRKRNRLMGYDYSREGLYFITFCVLEKACVFGHVSHEAMVLNTYGYIAEKQWHWLAEQYPYTILHAFIVMPNHVHAIIEIDGALDLVLPGNDQDSLVEGAIKPGESADRSRPVPTRVKSISALIGAYKTTTSKLIRQAGLTDFAWQRSFHDHIIRHESAFRKIEQYIYNNPSLWQQDVFYQDHSL